MRFWKRAFGDFMWKLKLLTKVPTKFCTLYKKYQTNNSRIKSISYNCHHVNHNITKESVLYFKIITWRYICMYSLLQKVCFFPKKHIFISKSMWTILRFSCTLLSQIMMTILRFYFCEYKTIYIRYLLRIK